MIGSIALGLVVDDTVHTLVRIQRGFRLGLGIDETLRCTLVQAGRPIIITSLVLAAGFSVLAFSSFVPNIYFGVLSAVIILLALLADLVVLPALLVVRTDTRRAADPA
jgi:hypothetical protein